MIEIEGKTIMSASSLHIKQFIVGFQIIRCSPTEN